MNLGIQSEIWNEDYRARQIASTIYSVNGRNVPIGSERDKNGQSTNKLLDVYLNYNRRFSSLFRMDLTAGYSYQKFNIGSEYDSGDVLKHAVNNEVELPKNTIYTPKVLVSFFGRANLSLFDRYLVTLTLRNDHSSMFSRDKRSGIFPAASIAWRIIDESFIRDRETLSNLKLRLGWGITGQQNLYGDEKVNINRYLPLYGLGTNAYSQYPVGNVNSYPVYPLAYNPSLKWEETTTWNLGLDFGFMRNRLSGTVDAYYKESKDLLADIQIPAGVNFANQMFMNSGAFSTKGIEIGINYEVVKNSSAREFNWNVSYNVSFNKLEIIDYPAKSSNERTFVTGGGGGIPISIFRLKEAPYAYNVYKQVYDPNGKAVEGVFADLDGNGKIDANDKYLYHSPNPFATMGLSTSLSWMNFDLSMAWRASLGNYIYNRINAMDSYSMQIDPSGSFLHNIISTKYRSPDDTKRVSDEWIENGSFLKWDNATLGYNFERFVRGTSLRVYLSVQNILIITKADVNDPEVAVGGSNAGVVHNLYPRPRTFLMGLNLNF